VRASLEVETTKQVACTFCFGMWVEVGSSLRLGGKIEDLWNGQLHA